MSDKKDQSMAGATELSEEDLGQVHGGDRMTNFKIQHLQQITNQGGAKLVVKDDLVVTNRRGSDG